MKGSANQEAPKGPSPAGESRLSRLNPFLSGVLLGSLLVLLGRALLRDRSFAIAQGAVDSNSSMIAVTGRVSGGQDILFVVDTQNRKLATYDSRGGRGIKLIAVRDIQYDLKAFDYENQANDGPRVFEVKKLIEEYEKRNQKEKKGGEKG